MEDKLRIASKAAQEAGTIVLRHYGSVAAMHKKETSYNLVTKTDLEAERAILEVIGREFPGHAFLAEELHTESVQEAEDLWIVDPLDGTNNYVHGFPHFCVSIAYARRGEVLLGVVYDPVRAEMFTATKGKGASLNGNEIRTSASENLREALVATGFYYDRGKVMERTLRGIHDLFKANMQGIRRTGSAALDLCWLACGRLDAYFEYELSVWDFAAGMLIVREAGGICTDRVGEPLGLRSMGVVASNGRFHSDFLRVVKWQEDGDLLQ